jgi:hypothetical protein
MVYEDAAARHVRLELVEHGRVLRFDTEDDHLVRRTVLEVGADGLPSAERVEVVKFVVKVNEDPAPEKQGVKENAAHGKTFVWRRRGKEDAYALYEEDDDVTEKHPRLVERLRAWRAARLPGKPVAVGMTWEVPAREFLEATGQTVPPGLEGSAVFTLEEVKDGVARISFEFKSRLRERGREIAGVQKGTWLVDLPKGRELSVELDGSMQFEGANVGAGKFTMRRTVTYR